MTRRRDAKTAEKMQNLHSLVSLRANSWGRSVSAYRAAATGPAGDGWVAGGASATGTARRRWL